MPGNYTHTTRVDGLILTADIYNADHQNHIDNLEPDKTDDWSQDVTQMRLMTNPGGEGSESLATSLAGELQRIRYILQAIGGGTQWYTPILAGRAEASVSSSAGVSQLTLSSLIPTGARVHAVVIDVTTGFGTSNGLTGLQVGDNMNGFANLDRWGTGIALALGTKTTGNDFLGDEQPIAKTGAADVLITALGGTFDATGALNVRVYYSTYSF